MVLGIGIDLVDVERFREKLTDELIEELFLPSETDYCRSQIRYWENFAARFAAKEAAFKALGHGLSSGLRFREVEVQRDMKTGAVFLNLHGSALRAMRQNGVSRLLVSLSHTRKSAIAMVIAEGPEKV